MEYSDADNSSPLSWSYINDIISETCKLKKKKMYNQLNFLDTSVSFIAIYFQKFVIFFLDSDNIDFS